MYIIFQCCCDETLTCKIEICPNWKLSHILHDFDTWRKQRQQMVQEIKIFISKGEIKILLISTI